MPILCPRNLLTLATPLVMRNTNLITGYTFQSFVGIPAPVLNILHTGQELPYSGKLSREKTFADWQKIRFSRRKLSWIACLCRAKECHAPNFTEKTFANSHKTTKFAKVFSLESFPLYSSFSPADVRCSLFISTHSSLFFLLSLCFLSSLG